MGCGPSAASPIQDGYVFRMDDGAPPQLARSGSLKKIASDAAEKETNLKPAGGRSGSKWANARNAVNGANAFQQGGLRRAVREKNRSSEHGWLGAHASVASSTKKHAGTYR